jgi:2-polyprenyl-3-methyl-5-hydroxy-6-metoxy-1,4-benzoquinol methylase
MYNGHSIGHQRRSFGGIPLITELQYRLLKLLAPTEPTHMSGQAYANRSKLTVLLGSELLSELKGKVVIDFGCGDGLQAVEIAQHGAARVIGVDILENSLARARQHAASAGVSDKCIFVTRTEEKADAVVSLDAFEHFDDPAAILDLIYDLLKPSGFIVASFGPTWYHPYGGHLFSVFPWAHLVFGESALLRWRSDIRHDGAKRFREVEGGLNQMTIRRFERIVAASRFRLETIEAVPIRKLAPIHNSLTREFTTSLVRCKLVKE